MTYRVYVGCDPGLSGAIAFRYNDDCRVYNLPVKDKHLDVKKFIQLLKENLPNRTTNIAYIEKARAFTGQGTVSTTTFLLLSGELSGAMQAYGLPLYYVLPQQWQKSILDIPVFTKKESRYSRRKKWKEASMNWAINKWPHLSITHDGQSDAICIAEYTKRNYLRA